MTQKRLRDADRTEGVEASNRLNRDEGALKMISTKTLAARLAGGDDYIRTKRGRVRGLALRTDLNPEAPEVIVVGMGPRVKQKAELLSRTHYAVPAYVKIKTNAWDYRGEFLPVGYRTDDATIERHRRNRERNNVSGILSSTRLIIRHS